MGPPRPVRVGRPDRAAEAVVGIVGDLDRVVLVLVRVLDDRQHRAEDLLLGDRRLVVHVGEDRGLNEPAAVKPRGPTAAGDQPRAVADALGDVPLDPVPLSLGDQRPDQRRGVEGVADRQR
jgi:hypothetical protein